MDASIQSTERRLVLVVGAIVFVDTTFYAAIAPLLPALAHDLPTPPLRPSDVCSVGSCRLSRPEQAEVR